ncbi:MAG: APC family permease [Candidatus Cybelea sp.]
MDETVGASSSLRTGSLTFIEVLATSIALIGPSMTPILIAPYMFANAGDGTWLAYLFGAGMLVVVALNLNQFARRFTGAGSMYEYAAENLGPALGALSGWSLLWAYVFVAAAVVGAMSLFVGLLLNDAGMLVASTPAIYVAIAIILGAVCWQAAYRGVQVSAIVMLVLEAISVAIILLVVGIVLLRHGPALDPNQLTIKGGVPNWGLAVMTAVFSLVGFESATAFGAEAKRPLVAIPRAVIASVLFASAFFIIATYAEIVGLGHAAKPLDQQTFPLGTLVGLYDIGYLRVPIAIGALFSAFSVCLACITTAGRIAYAVAKAGLFPRALAAIEPRHNTPHVAVTLITVVVVSIAAAALAAGVLPIDVFNNCGTLSSFGFIVIYAAISIAASLYVKRIGALRWIDVAISALAVVLLAVPAVSLIYSVPAPPQRWFGYYFLGFMVIGWLWFSRAALVSAQRRRDDDQAAGDAKREENDKNPDA